MGQKENALLAVLGALYLGKDKVLGLTDKAKGQAAALADKAEEAVNLLIERGKVAEPEARAFVEAMKKLPPSKGDLMCITKKILNTAAKKGIDIAKEIERSTRAPRTRKKAESVKRPDVPSVFPD